MAGFSLFFRPMDLWPGIRNNARLSQDAITDQAEHPEADQKEMKPGRAVKGTIFRIQALVDNIIAETVLHATPIASDDLNRMTLPALETRREVAMTTGMPDLAQASRCQRLGAIRSSSVAEATGRVLGAMP